MRRRSLLVRLAIALLLVAAVAYFARDRVSVKQYHRIKFGMSRPEVEALLGTPGNYAGGPTQPIIAPGPSDPPLLSERGADHDENGPFPSDYSIWQGDTGEILVRYGPKGVWYKQWWPAVREKQSFIENLRWRVEHRWGEGGRVR